MNKIYLVDVSNRDGVQTAHLGLSKLSKTLINMYLNDMGIYGDFPKRIWVPYHQA
jgi:homocitrate synthase NifV